MPDEPFHLALFSRAGTHKTVLFKRFAAYYAARGYLINMFDPKADDMLDATKLGKGARLYYKEFPTTLPVIGCLPSFAIKSNFSSSKLDRDIRRKFAHEFAFNINDVSDVNEICTLLAIKHDASMMATIRPLIVNSKSINQLKYNVMRDKKIHYLVKNAMLSRIDALILDEMFDTDKYEQLPMFDIWKKNMISCINFYSREPINMQYTVGKIIELQKLFSEKNNKRKLNFFDDASFYLKYPRAYSTEMVKNTINNWRTLKFSGIYGIQNPDDMDNGIISECKFKLIGDVGRPESLRPFLTSEQFEVVSNLISEGAPEYQFQYVLLTEDRRFIRTGYPLGPIAGHVW